MKKRNFRKNKKGRIIPNFMPEEEVARRTREITERIRNKNLHGTMAKILALPEEHRTNLVSLYNAKMGKGGVAPSIAKRKAASRTKQKAKPVIKSKDILLSSENRKIPLSV